MRLCLRKGTVAPVEPSPGVCVGCVWGVCVYGYKGVGVERLKERLNST